MVSPDNERLYRPDLPFPRNPVMPLADNLSFVPGYGLFRPKVLYLRAIHRYTQLPKQERLSQLVVVIGEPTSGKSTLVGEFAADAQRELRFEAALTGDESMMPQNCLAIFAYESALDKARASGLKPGKGLYDNETVTYYGTADQTFSKVLREGIERGCFGIIEVAGMVNRGTGTIFSLATREHAFAKLPRYQVSAIWLTSDRTLADYASLVRTAFELPLDRAFILRSFGIDPQVWEQSAGNIGGAGMQTVLYFQDHYKEFLRHFVETGLTDAYFTRKLKENPRFFDDVVNRSAYVEQHLAERIFSENMRLPPSHASVARNTKLRGRISFSGRELKKYDVILQNDTTQ